MIPVNLLPVAKVAALPLLTAIVVGSCTAQHFRVKINNMELEWTAKVAQAQARAAQQIAAQQKITSEVENDYQSRIADLDARYADAAGRLRGASAAAASVRTVSSAAEAPDAAAGSSRLPDGSRIDIDSVSLAELLRQADENTQKLIGLQMWVDRQAQAD